MCLCSNEKSSLNGESCWAMSFFTLSFDWASSWPCWVNRYFEEEKKNAPAQYSDKYFLMLVPLLDTPNNVSPNKTASMTFNVFDVTIDCIYSHGVQSLSTLGKNLKIRHNCSDNPNLK